MAALSTPPRHVVLVGPRGAGKSRVGSLVARRLHRALVDADVGLGRCTSVDVDHSDLRSGDRAWFEQVIDHGGPSVIAAPSSLCDELLRLERDDTVVFVVNPSQSVELTAESIVDAVRRLSTDRRYAEHLHPPRVTRRIQPNG